MENQFLVSLICHHYNSIFVTSYERKKKMTSSLPTFQLEGLVVNFGVINIYLAFANFLARGTRFQLQLHLQILG